MNVLNTEQALIGAAFLNSGVAGILVAQLELSDFLNDACRNVFSRMQTAWSRTGSLDVAYICDDAAAQQTARMCAESCPSNAEENVLRWVKQLRQAGKLRAAKLMAFELAGDDNITYDEALTTVSDIATTLSGNENKGDEVTTMEEAMKAWREKLGTKTQYIHSGFFPKLDYRCQIVKGDMVVIGARPSCGKTMTAINLALGWASKGHKVVFFSLETSTKKIYQRLLASWANWDFGEVKDGTLPFDDYDLGADIASLSNLPIYIVQAAGKSVEWMRLQAAKLKADIAIVDYLQLIPSKGSSRYEIVTQISQQLHNWAQTDGICVVPLAQLNRASATGGQIPTVADLKESGQIEQDADIILLLDRKVDVYSREVRRFSIDIAKNKDGETGVIDLVWDAAHMRVRELEK